MTRFGIVGLAAIFTFILLVVTKTTDEDTVQIALMMLSAVTLGAVIAVEAAKALHDSDDKDDNSHT